MASYMDAVNGKHTDGREQEVGMKRMTRTEIEELAQQMEKFADFLFAQGDNSAGNRMLDAVDVAEAQLED